MHYFYPETENKANGETFTETSRMLNFVQMQNQKY